jgi:ABC-type uncharacterized transport system substrate-binding protein
VKPLARWLVVLALLTVPLVAEAQQAGKIPRVGIVFHGPQGASVALIRAFGEGLQERGFVEGRNLSVEHRFAEGRADRVPTIAADLTKLNVDVFVTSVDRWAIAVRQAAANTPIVMTMAEDPVGAGLVKSLAHPGGSITGLTIVAGPEIYGKNLELLKEILPKGARIAILFNADSPINARYLKTIQEAARTLEVSLIPVGVRRSRSTFSSRKPVALPLLSPSYRSTPIHSVTPDYAAHRATERENPAATLNQAAVSAGAARKSFGGSKRSDSGMISTLSPRMGPSGSQLRQSS